VIPVIGVPILNRPELLADMVASIDTEVGQLIVIDNGGVVEDFTHPCVREVHVVHLPHNLGVGAAWNLIFKLTPKADWWAILNSDLVLGPGDLDRLASSMKDPAPHVTQLLGFAAFGINQGVLDAVGLFDENFHPAYCEDVDYVRRCNLAEVPIPSIEGNLDHVGSATIYGNQRYRTQNDMTYAANRDYYRRKWGGDVNGTERFSTPFDQGGRGDVPIQWQRIRQLAWRRA
jgi:GT2 family glycosyltransferase